MKTQKRQVWFVRDKEEEANVLVLLHCSFHNVNHKKFQSSGKEAAAAATAQVIQPVFSCFELLLFFSPDIALAVLFFLFVFFSQLTCLNEEEETFGLLFPESSSLRWATLGSLLCCSSSVLNARRRESSPTR